MVKYLDKVYFHTKETWTDSKLIHRILWRRAFSERWCKATDKLPRSGRQIKLCLHVASERLWALPTNKVTNQLRNLKCSRNKDKMQSVQTLCHWLFIYGISPYFSLPLSLFLLSLAFLFCLILICCVLFCVFGSSFLLFRSSLFVCGYFSGSWASILRCWHSKMIWITSILLGTLVEFFFNWSS